MKNLFFGFVALFAISTFATAKTTPFTSANFVKSVVETEYSNDDLTYPCRWRTCYYDYYGNKHCSAWTSGICLDEIVIHN